MLDTVSLRLEVELVADSKAHTISSNITFTPSLARSDSLAENEDAVQSVLQSRFPFCYGV